jgi:hypothetical protein
MTAWEPLRRRVYVLGKEALMDDLHAVAERAELDGVPLVLFSLGYPVSPAQERIMDEALKLVGEMRLQLEMELVARMEELPDLLAEGDEVAVLSSGFEHLRLEWLLRERLEQREHASLF